MKRFACIALTMMLLVAATAGTCGAALSEANPQDAQSASARWIDTEGTADTPEAKALRQRIGELFTRAEGTMN